MNACYVEVQTHRISRIEKSLWVFLDSKIHNTHPKMTGVRRDHSFKVGTPVQSAIVRHGFRVMYVLLSLLAALYGVCVFQYGCYNLFGEHGPFAGTSLQQNWTRWNDAAMAYLTGSGMDFYEGDGSTTLSQSKRYGESWHFMSVHQCCGGIMIVTSIILMNAKFRDGKWRKWHRRAGNIYAVAHIFNLYGSLGFLLKHTGLFPETTMTSSGGIFGGSTFAILLWLYWIVAAASLSLGIFHIARGEVQRHRSWMAYNYGTTMGAAFLRLGWGVFGKLLPHYRQKNINMGVTVLFIASMIDVAAIYTSFAHRKKFIPLTKKSASTTGVIALVLALPTAGMIVNQCLLRFGALGEALRFDDLDIIVMGSELAANTSAHAAELFVSGGELGRIAGMLHAGSWTCALIFGALLLPRVLKNPNDVAHSWLRRAYVLASVGVAVSTATWFGQLSFSYFLLHPEAEESQFYKTLPTVLWNTKAASVLLKVLIFNQAATKWDVPARTVEWMLHSYGEVIFYGLFLAATWAIRPHVPTYQDAWAPAAVFSTLACNLIAYTCATYTMESEPEPVSAKTRGLFAHWWRGSQATVKQTKGE